MATLADITSALADLEVSQHKMIDVMKKESASIADLSAQLAAALANGNSSADVQTIIDRLNADKAEIDAAIPADPAPPVVDPSAPAA